MSDLEVVDNFTNDSAMMIAWERALETKRPDALFNDPFAEALAGSKGESLSEKFGANCAYFGFEGWAEFHKTWVAVRTRFIDDAIEANAKLGTFAQLVNLGAGMDTRPCRMECFKEFKNGAFNVDMAVVNQGKQHIFDQVLKAPSSYCTVRTVNLDFLDGEKTLATELKPCSQFDESCPSVFISEGLIMYLGAAGKVKLIADVSAVASPGSVFVLQFMDASESAGAKANPDVLANALSVEEATVELTKHGWVDLKFSKFGDAEVNFGRYPTEKFKPSASFSFCVCRKGSQ
eukprot:TRINITY_DN32527_c0_g1_i1.p1 TRINITY_DN32527_c0_g1~~TRINITY_DN32527_c0_g1_i1.p1  ORF type:complete len:290 (-),score=42.24 TRINITY_DN32527_c0_g1_i1:102-971(-)